MDNYNMAKIHSTVLALSMKHYLRKWLDNFDKKQKHLYEHFERNMMEGTSRYKKDTIMAYLISLASSMDYYVLCDIVNYAFTWSDAPEGHDYWSSIHDEWYYVRLPRFYRTMPESMTSLIEE